MTNTPTQPPEHYFPRPPADDEISLVDIALILVRRWKMMAVIFLVVVLAALAFALSKTDTYRYVSIYNVAERQPSNGSGVGTLESPQSVVARIDNYYFDVVSNRLIEENGIQRLGFETEAEAPDNVAFLTISSETDEANADLVKEYHQAVLDEVKADQDRLLEKRRATLEQQVETTSASLEAAKNSTRESAAELIASYTDKLFSVEQQLTYLAEGHIQRVASQGREPVGVSKALILALAIVLGGMLAVMAAFIAEFVGTVRKASQQRG